MSNLCNAATCAKLALDKVVCEAVSAAALNLYAQIVDFLRNTLCFDLTVFFKVVALLAIICWIQNWLLDIIKFICNIPRVIKNLFCGKFNLCVFNCEQPEHSEHSELSEQSEDY